MINNNKNNIILNILNYKNLFIEERNFNHQTLKFERLSTFDERNFENETKKNIEREMEKFIIELTRRRGDIERCANKIQESIKKIEMNDKEIHGALQNSNINWQTHYSVHCAENPAAIMTNNTSATTAAAAAAAASTSASGKKNGLFVIQGPLGTLSTFIKENEPLVKLQPK
nr:MAG: hypothetical protein [Porcellio scaber clopovirus]